MSQDVVQWLNQIKALQSDVAALQEQLVASQDSGNNWRQRFETEALQRRNDADRFQAQITELQTQITELQTRQAPNAIAQERDQLAAALAAEKANHEQSRKDLTTALSDAMELLSKGKSRLPDVVDPG
jgi:phage shock protein A